MFVGAVQAIDVWRKDKTQFAPVVQRAGPLVMALLFVLSLYLVLGPGGWVWNNFTYYQSQVICFPSTWKATIRPFLLEYNTRFEYSNNNIEYYGPENYTDVNWTNTLINWTNKTNADITQFPPYIPTQQ
jgi:hypothetical protein